MATTSSPPTVRSQLFTPPAHKSLPRTASAAVNRSMQSATPLSRARASPTANKENASFQLSFVQDAVLVRQTPIKVFPSFLSPTSNASSATVSVRSSLSPLSSASANSSVVVISPRQPLATRSPNISGRPAQSSAVHDKPKPTATGRKFAKPTAFHAKSKRTSPPSQPVSRPKKPAKPTSAPHARPVQGGRRPQSSSPQRLKAQVVLLHGQLAEEKERNGVLMAEVQRLRDELAEERRRGRATEADDEVVGKYWHPVAAWEYYDAVNSVASSASEKEGSASEADEDEEDEDAAEDAEDEDEEDDSDEEDDASDADDASDSDKENDSDAARSPPSSPTKPTHQPRHSSGSAIDDILAKEMTAASIDEHNQDQNPADQSIELVRMQPDRPLHAEDGDDEEDDEEDESHRSTSTYSVTSSLSCPNFQDVFPYERNLYLLGRHYHFLHRLYSCPDAVTFKAQHVQSKALVVIKVSEGYSVARSHPKEIRLLTRAQGHRNVMTLRGWYGIEPTRCYAFVTDWVENVGIERLWHDDQDRRQYMHDMLQGMDHLHSRGILYRDVKPSNVLWNPHTRHATIIDYDVATYYDPVHRHRSVVGTTGYMAPEISHLDEVTSSSTALGYTQLVDVYSAGVVFGQLLFHIHEDEVADNARPDTKGPAMVERVLHYAHQHGGRIGAEYHLLLRMLTPEPGLRIPVKEALAHPYFTQRL